MIKVLNEEPIAYNKHEENNLDDIEVWIYKNPTPDEVDELKEECQNVRVVVSPDNNYYVASSYYFTHNDIVKFAKINKDIDLVIFFKDNVMTINLYGTNIVNLKPVYTEMIKNRLINNDTILLNHHSYTDAGDWYKPQLRDKFSVDYDKSLLIDDELN